MKTISGFALIMFLATGPGFAQKNTATPVNNRPISISGCLSGTNGNYTLTTYSDELYQLKGNDQLSQHIGQTVRVTGIESAGGEQTSANPNAVASALSSAPPVIQVQSMKKIFDTCQD